MVVTERRKFVSLTFVLGISEVLYVELLRFDVRSHIGRLTVITFLLFGLYAAAVAIVRKSDTGPVLKLVVAGAVLFRLTVIPVGLPTGASLTERLAMMRDDIVGSREHFRPNLLLDDDVWRYLWDGRIAAGAGNPYLAAPADRRLDRFAQEPMWRVIRRNVNHPELATIYPPVAQVIFLVSYLLAPGSVVMLKIVLMAIDLAGIAFLIGCLRRTKRSGHVILYAWNPLVILMLVASAHADGIAVTLLTLTVFLLLASRTRWAGVTLGLAALAKLSPLVLVPLFIRRTGRAGTLALLTTLVLGSLPFFLLRGGGLHSFGEFAKNWDFNSAAFQLVRGALTPFVADPGRVARIILGVLVAEIALAIAGRSGRRAESFASPAAATLGALLVLSPTVMPWYATWPLALAVIAGNQMIWIVFSALVCFSFPMTADWQTHTAWLWPEFGLLLLAGAMTFRSWSAPSGSEVSS